jgi:hypothetical protein
VLVHLATLPLFALVACACANHAVKPRPPVDALADCPRAPRIASADDISDMVHFVEQEERDLATDRARCAPARAECLRDCELYAVRCPGPHFAEDTCVQLEPLPPAEFCAHACSGRSPYLARAAAFRDEACKAAEPK